MRPGEKVPVDGVVVEGDERGRRIDAHRRADPGARSVRATASIGGTVNGTGSFVMRAERVGADTLLAQIVRMVSEAQRSRAPIQRLADVVAAYFVPAVVVLSRSLTFVAWRVAGPAAARSRTRSSTQSPC